MLKVTEILKLTPYIIHCKFNTGEIKKINIKPLIESQTHLDGIKSLYDENIFKNVKIGSMGEIYWENIVTTSYQNKKYIWNYDLSPEFIFENGI